MSSWPKVGVEAKAILEEQARPAGRVGLVQEHRKFPLTGACAARAAAGAASTGREAQTKFPKNGFVRASDSIESGLARFHLRARRLRQC